MLVKISEIIVENRVRKYNGSLDPLERSINNLGLLHPIGVTSDMKLIFGGRRLRACKNLGWETIPAQIFNIDADDPVAALKMERSENDIRLDLTPTEKVEIAWRIEQAMEGRQGQRTDLQQLPPNLAEVQPNTKTTETPVQPEPNRKELVQNFAQVEPGTKTRDIAAKAVGMNRETYRQAKAVVNSGNEEIIQAMDSGKKSINVAYNSVKNKTPQTEFNTTVKAVYSYIPKAFKITLRDDPVNDAKELIKKGGLGYCSMLAIELLKAAGHNVETD